MWHPRGRGEGGNAVTNATRSRTSSFFANRLKMASVLPLLVVALLAVCADGSATQVAFGRRQGIAQALEDVEPEEFRFDDVSDPQARRWRNLFQIRE